ncbi:hypothetical protein AJ79_07082 [Helicocarpus griseus UAMH5409]|uniref:O-methylsterigmatocystin oxidoreductase n=1 Tax=Helicocarpus griseus UAMH5409 TaxID=1447875 RepID=A0A2B7X5T8_9EURO|nr:hypothetical protein AJ79_07082 [Helicocarpus griseus UAMH5409]
MYLVLILVGLLGLYMLSFLGRKSSGAPLPPGPKPLPIVGNIRDLPDPNRPDWLHWLKYKDLYGPISTVSVFGQRIVILNSVGYAIDLLEKRSAVHSDRPDMPMAKLSGWGSILGMVGYSKTLHSYRKHMHREIGSKQSVSKFDHIQKFEVHRFLLRSLDRPNDLVAHVRKLAGALILKITYGYSIEPHGNDPLVDIADTALEQFSLAARPGTWILDFAPFFQYFPPWFPGIKFHRFAEACRKQMEAFSELPLSFTKQQMAKGVSQASYVSNLLDAEAAVPGSISQAEIKWSAASLYAGGADTTVSTISSFFLAMALFPEVQKRAQEEIDLVVGQNRLPEFSDRDKLPYVDAILKEALRWHPVAPMGLPHRAMQDDVLEGFLIPKGSIILANIWAMFHDPNNFKDPMEFKPERFLGLKPERDPHTLAFGFGRRACPGRVVADTNLYLTIAQALAAFNISKAKDFEPEFLPGVVSHPAPFEVNIEARSKKYEEMVQSVKDHPWEKGQAETILNMQAQ